MAEQSTHKKAFYGWWLLAVCWLIVFFTQAFPNYGATVINGFMAKDFKASRESMGELFSVYLMMGGLPGLIAGGLVARTGSRLLIVIGGLACVAGSALMAFWVRSIDQALLAFGVVVGFSILAGGFLGTQYALAQWFRRRRAMAMSILYTATGVGGFVAPPLLNALIEHFNNNWRVGWLVLIATGAASTILAFLFVRDKPESLGQNADGAATPHVASEADQNTFRTHEEWELKEVLARPALWVLLGSFTAATIAFHVFLSHGVLHLRDQGFTPAQAASAVSIASIASLGAKTIIGIFGDRFDPRYLWVLALGLMGVGMVIFADAHTMPAMIAFAACIGAGFGGALVCMVTVFPNYFGVKVFPVLSGLSLTIQGSLVAVMPLLTGYLFDKTGSYQTPFYTIAGFCWIMAVILLLLKRPQRRSAAA